MPVARPQHQHDPNLAQANFRSQPLKAGTEGSAAAGPALIFIDHLDATRRPTQLDRSLAQIVLAFGTFAILGHLQPGRLPYVDEGRPLGQCVL